MFSCQRNVIVWEEEEEVEASDIPWEASDGHNGGKLVAERTLEVATIQPPQATYMNMTRGTFTDCYKLFTRKVEKVVN
jgi:hypothetical protein